MEKEYRDFNNLLESKPDFLDVLNSQQFRQASLVDPDLARRFMTNRVLKIHGDIRTITIGAFNNVCMAITIDNKFNGICDCTDVRVDVPRHLCDSVLRLRTDTGVSVLAKYKKLDVIIDSFELVEILESEKDLNFPYCVCLGDNPDERAYADVCHRVLGYHKSEYTEYCPLCGSHTKYVKNVYADDFKKYFG